jgi:parallel beta-helix repeat protein
MKNKLIGIIICMLLVGTVLPASGTLIIDKITTCYISGNTLYVGGSGGGNYTSIQEAINDTVDGDTVFVYDDSSPYIETLIVDKSINLIGENKETTIIDSKQEAFKDPILIKADNVTLIDFTIKGGYGGFTYNSGIMIKSHGNIIKNNIIKDNEPAGIQIGYLEQPSLEYPSNNNIIEDNVIINNGRYGIYLSIASKNIIKGNFITSQLFGIRSGYRGSKNLILNNNISFNKEGIHLSGEKNSIIQRNAIFGNELGIQIWYSYEYQVLENNIFNNDEDAKIQTGTIDLLLSWKENLWDSNYWGQPMQKPVRIPGTCDFVFANMILNLHLSFPFYRFDWNPANEPYDI